jgi:glycosyltransferase involved in cell wall biosynthesis
MAAAGAPKVSFVVPAHNEEAGLPRTLAAIQAEIARAGCPAEVIVVDNASTDGTARVAARFPGVRSCPSRSRACRARGKRGSWPPTAIWSPT